jgi:hypothetical protein
VVEGNSNATGGQIRLMVTAKLKAPSAAGGWASQAKNVFVREHALPPPSLSTPTAAAAAAAGDAFHSGRGGAPCETALDCQLNGVCTVRASVPARLSGLSVSPY